MEKEVWKYIPDYEGYYMASDKGRIKSLRGLSHISKRRKTMKGGVILSQQTDDLGYKRTTLYGGIYGYERKTFLVHRLVAFTFIVNSSDKPQVNHIDSNPSNNCVDNLEWCTASENTIHGYIYGNAEKVYGKDHNKSRATIKLTEDFAFIDEYESATSASAVNNISLGNIAMACRGERPRAGGYRWQYADDYYKSK